MPSKNNVYRKPSSTPKTNIQAKPGQLYYKGGRHPVQLNQTEEYEVYAANFSVFPDALFYPRRSTDRDNMEFLAACMNTTLKADINREGLLKLNKSGEVYMRVFTNVLEFLCSENYNKQPSRAHLLAGGLWEILVAIGIPLVLKWLG